MHRLLAVACIGALGACIEVPPMPEWVVADVGASEAETSAVRDAGTRDVEASPDGAVDEGSLSDSGTAPDLSGTVDEGPSADTGTPDIPDGLDVPSVADVGPDLPDTGADAPDALPVDVPPDVLDCSSLDSACTVGEWSSDAGGCVAVPQAGLGCDDGDPCTESDICQDGGECAGVAKDCDDGDPCTEDSCGAGGACEHVLSTWERVFGGAGADTFAGLTPFEDGFLAVGGTTSEGDDDGDAWLVRADTEGIAKWTQTYGGPWADYADDVTVVQDGIIVVGSSTASEGGGGEPTLWKLDNEGGVIWSKTYGAGSSWTSVAIVPGGLIVAGATRVAGLDAAGEILWDDTSGTTLTGWGFARATGNGAIVVGNLAQTAAAAFYHEETAMGWAETYPNASWTMSELRDVRAHPEGGFFGVGVGALSTGGLEPIVMRLGSDGALQWSLGYPLGNDEIATSLAIDATGEVVVVAGEPGAVRIFGLDASGSELWEEVFGAPGGENALAAVVPHPLGGFSVAGTRPSTDGTNQDGWLIRTDAQGKVCGL